MENRARLVLLGLLSTLALGSGCSLAPASGPGSATGEPTAVLHARAFRDEAGAAIAIDEYRGAPFVLTEVYTSCTVRCPMTLHALTQMDRALRARGVVASFVLVTLDPKTDTPERLRRFKASHALPASFHLLSGSEAHTRELSRYLGVRAAYDDAHIDHDVAIALFDARGRERRRYAGWDIDADVAARAVQSAEDDAR